MLKKFWKNKQNPLDTKIETILAEMDLTDPTTPEYKTLLKRVDQLHKIKAEERRGRVSRDTMWVVLGNIVVAAVIVGHEYGHASASKAWNHIVRPRDPGNKH
jgi:hypothetical protein